MLLRRSVGTFLCKQKTKKRLGGLKSERVSTRPTRPALKKRDPPYSKLVLSWWVGMELNAEQANTTRARTVVAAVKKSRKHASPRQTSADNLAHCPGWVFKAQSHEWLPEKGTEAYTMLILRERSHKRLMLLGQGCHRVLRHPSMICSCRGGTQVTTVVGAAPSNSCTWGVRARDAHEALCVTFFTKFFNWKFSLNFR